MAEAPQKKFLLEILIPTGELFSGQVTLVTIPGSEGYFGVLPGHAPMIASLKPGLVTIGQGEQLYFVSFGVAEVLPDTVTLFADYAVDTKSVDLRQSRAQLEELTVKAKSGSTDELDREILILTTLLELLEE